MVTAEYFAEYEKRLAFYKAQTQWLEAEKRLAELRYNENHDPKSGKFTSSPDKKRKKSNKKATKALTKQKISVKLDKKGHPFTYPECTVTREEYACFIQNVNTIYKAKYSGKKMCKYYSGELDVMFYFENHGFDDYSIYRKG